MQWPTILFAVMAAAELPVILVLTWQLLRHRQAGTSAEAEEQAAFQVRIGSMEGCSGVYKGAVVPIESGEEVVIGRDRSMANLIVCNSSISRKHCGIRYNGADGTYTVTDYSLNGVANQNGELFPRNTPVTCSAGTRLILAQSDNEFQLK